MVGILAPSHCSASKVQDFDAMPSTWMTQAPHCEVSQPTWVPVSRRFSRRNCTSKVRASTSPVTALPFTVMDTAGMTFLPNSRPKAIFSLRPPGAAAARVRNVADFGPNAPWNGNNSEPPARAGSRDSAAGNRSNRGDRCATCRDIGGKILEKVVGDLLGRTVDQALAELGELAADLRLDIVGEQGAAVLFGQRDRGAALGEAGDPTVALARNLVTVGRVEIGQVHLAFEARFHRAYFGDGNRLQFGDGDLVELLAAGDAGFQHLGIVELCIHTLAAGWDLNPPRHDHRHRRRLLGNASQTRPWPKA